MHTIRCKALLLDLDGTLIDSDADAVKYWSAWAESVGAEPQEVFRLRESRRRHDVISMLLPGLSEEEIEDEVERLRSAALANAKNVVALPGAKSFLAELPARTWAIVTSNDREIALARLNAVGLPIPDILVTAEDVSAGKPDPEGYLMATRLLGVPACEAVVIEDSPVGIEAARAAGITTIAIREDRTRHGMENANVSADTLTDISVRVENGDIVLMISSYAPSVTFQPGGRARDD